MKKINHLSAKDHALVGAAVTEAEHGTGGEIVTIVTTVSDPYTDIAWQWAAAIMFIAFACIAAFPEQLTKVLTWAAHGWEYEFHLAEILPVLFLMLFLKFIAVRLLLSWMPLRLALTPRKTKARRVHERAIQFFKVGAESRTAKKTGILLYLSMGEHMAEIVADEAIHKAVSPEIWGDAMIALIDHVRAGRPGEGMAAAVAQIGVILAKHFPIDANDSNELPDRLIEL